LVNFVMTIIWITLIVLPWAISPSVFIALTLFILNVIILSLLIWSIPANLNWSYGLYNFNLYTILISAVISIISFSILYFQIGVLVIDANDTFIDSLHLSVSMFSGIGYGQVLPSKWKIVSSSQSLIGTLYLPLLAAYLWMFIKNK